MLTYNKVMKITKYEHACLVVEEQGRKLVIDPGVYSESFIATPDIDCVIVTHVHADHFDLEKLKAIRYLNPNVSICTVQEVAVQADGLDVEVVEAGGSCSHGSFNTSFFGGQHKPIHSSLPTFQNVGIFINEKLYYPGDSFYVPEKLVIDTLAAPAGSPWANVSEEMDFIIAIKAKRVFPTHNAHISKIGQQGRDNWLRKVTEESGGEYIVLKAGESIEV